MIYYYIRRDLVPEFGARGRLHRALVAGQRELVLRAPVDRELARQNELLELKKRETDAVIAKYDAEKRRWRELIAAKGSAAPQSSQGITPTSANPAVVAPGTATAKQ